MNNNFNRYARNQLSMEAEQDRIYQSVLEEDPIHTQMIVEKIQALGGRF